MTEPLKSTSRFPWALWGCISGLIFFLVLVFTIGYIWLLRYYEQEAYKELSAKERAEFDAWLKEPIEYPHELLVARPAKSAYLLSQEKLYRTQLRSAYERVPTVFWSGSKRERDTSTAALLEPPLNALTHLCSSQDYVSNERLPTGINSISPDDAEFYFYCLRDYARCQIRLGEQVKAAEMFPRMTMCLKGDPECEQYSYTAKEILTVWTQVVEITTDTAALRTHHSAIEECSSKLADVYTEISFLPDRIKHLPRLMLEYGYISELPQTRKNFLQLEVEEDNFYWHLRRTLPEGHKLKQYLDKERMGKAQYYIGRSVPRSISKLQFGPLKAAFRKLSLANNYKNLVWTFKYDRETEAMEHRLIQGYNDLATSITLRLAEAERGG